MGMMGGLAGLGVMGFGRVEGDGGDGRVGRG